jgi:hypothetical protein
MPAEKGPAWIRVKEDLLHVPSVTGYLDGTGALTLLDTRVAEGFVQTLEKVTFTSTTALAGAGGTQTFKVRKGGATGTVVCTFTLTLADFQTTAGKSKNFAVAAADQDAARFGDTDTLSLTRDASGTAFTGGAGVITLTWRQKPQARI